MKLFLSHHSRDKSTVREFKRALPEFLHSWLDETSLQWGSNLAANLRKTIMSEVDFLVIFLSGDTLNSTWVNKELGWALERERELDRVFILPIVLAEATVTTLPPEIRSRLYLQSDYSSNSIKQVANQAGMHLFQLLIKLHERLSDNTLREVVRQGTTGKYGHNDFWTRPTLQLPLGSSVVERLLTVLKGAVTVAAEALCEVIPGADPSKVRANIFLPTSDSIQTGDICTLTIVELNRLKERYLQVNMRNTYEVRIPFRPNEGATGKVFVKEKAVGVVVNPKWLNGDDAERKKLKDEKWIYVEINPTEDLSVPGRSLYTETLKSEFNMSDFLERRVDKDLMWIISLPIFLAVDGKYAVVGVFNVDCREHWIEPRTLRAIYYRIAPFAGALSGIIRGLPVDHIVIFRVRA